MIYHFDTQDARAHGTDEAILLYNIVGWLRLNKAEARNQFDGHTWSYNTARALVEVFEDIWSEQQIRRLINKLVEKGVLLKGNYNHEVGRRRDDRTLWLALVDEARIQPKDTSKDTAQGSSKTIPKGGLRPPKSSPKRGDPALENAAESAQNAAQNGLEIAEIQPVSPLETPRECAAEPPSESTEARVEFGTGLRRNRFTPPSESTDASVEFDGHIKEQKETDIRKTTKEKQQQPLLPPQPLPAPQLAFDDEPLAEGEEAAAAAVSLRFEEQDEAAKQEARNGAASAALLQALCDVGVTRVEACALIAETCRLGTSFSLEDIQRHLAWLPYQNCKSPGYWLPRYIREGWPKPKQLEAQEAKQLETHQPLKPRNSAEQRQAVGQPHYELAWGNLGEEERVALQADIQEAMCRDNVAFRNQRAKHGLGWHLRRDAIKDFHRRLEQVLAERKERLESRA